MRRHTITIDHDTFVLKDDARAREIERAALTAMRQGGGMINVFHDDTSNVSVLVSPGVPIFFASDDVPDESQNFAGGSEWGAFDISFLDA